MAFSLKAVFGMDATGLKTELRQVRKEVNDTASKFGSMGVAAAAAAFVAFGKSAMDLAGNLADTANRLRITTDELQALQFQAEQGGVKTEQFNVALAKTRQTITEAAEGNKKLSAAFADLGLNIDQLQRMPLAKQYEAIAKGFTRAHDQAKAFNAVSDIFGAEVGPRLAGTLRDLAENGLAGVTREAKEAGRVMSAETIVALDKAGDAIEDWKRRITISVGTILVNFRSEEGLKALGFGLLEVAARFGGRIVDALGQANDIAGAVFKGTFEGVANWFRDQLVSAAQRVAEAFNKVLPERFEFNVAGLDALKSSGDYVAASIHSAIAETTPTAFADEWGNFWKVQKEEAQAAAEALNKSDFAKELKQFKDAGKPVRMDLSEGADAIDQAGRNAGDAIGAGADGLVDAGEAVRMGLDDVARKLSHAAGQIGGALLESMYGSRYSRDQIGNASDEALRAVINRAKEAEKQALRDEWNSPNVLNARGTSQGVLQARNTANAAEQELAFRNSIRGLYNRGGASAVYSDPRMDPIAVDNLLAKYTDAVSLQERQVTALERIREGLARAGIVSPTG